MSEARVPRVLLQQSRLRSKLALALELVVLVVVKQPLQIIILQQFEAIFDEHIVRVLPLAQTILNIIVAAVSWRHKR